MAAVASAAPLPSFLPSPAAYAPASAAPLPPFAPSPAAYALASSLAPLAVDGAAGGGQVLRSAVALAAVTGRAVRVSRIRAGRPKPGLQAQHLCAVRALADLTGARLEGAAIGATELLFEPAPPAARSGAPALLGRAHAPIDVGSAGSATLVLQTLLPSLLAAPLPSSGGSGGGGSWLETSVTVVGGTANPFAPPAAFFVETFLPALNEALRCAAAARGVLVTV